MDPNAMNYYGESSYNPYSSGGTGQSYGAESGGTQYNSNMYDGDNNNYYNQQYYGQESADGYECDPKTIPQQETFAPGSLYPIDTLQPQLHGAPVSSLAYDSTYKAIYVASPTQSLSRGRFNHRASILSTHSTTDGMLYSSVAAHPEAPPKVLQKVYNAVYSVSTHASPTNTSRIHIPSHALRPAYGDSDPMLPTSTAQTFQMGINKLIPLGEGYVSSVSPSAVRIHTHGGLQTADFHTEGMLSMTHHPNHDNTITHVTVGGMSLDPDVSARSGKSDLLCLDIFSMRVVASFSSKDAFKMGVSALATSDSRGAIVAGCTDGNIRVLDSRLREMARIKSHLGGVVDVAVSQGGNLVATAGYASRGSSSHPLYSFPDPNVRFQDMRYLGRGGIPHMFTGLNGGPRFLSFLPDIEGMEKDRLLAVSGQAGGGMQIIVPFEEQPSADPGTFIVPQLGQGEFISALSSQEDLIGFGTSSGNVLQYKVSEYKRPKSLSANARSFSSGYETSPSASASFRGQSDGGSGEKKPLVLPPFGPPVSELSLDANLLMLVNGKRRAGANDQIKSIFSAYAMGRQPVLTPLKDNVDERFGPLSSDPMVGASRNEIRDDRAGNNGQVCDFMSFERTSDLGLDLMEDHRPSWVLERARNAKEPSSNPNKFLYRSTLYESMYQKSYNRFKKRSVKDQRSQDSKGDLSLLDVPHRYQLALRPTNKSAATFSTADQNNTNLVPGWDYPPTMPNSFVAPVLMLLYFFPEARSILLNSQFHEKVNGRKEGLVSELSFIFHRIESLARYALVFRGSRRGEKAKLGAWSPSNFVSCLGNMPEAEQLQILDESPAAVDVQRRPEAFYRFLLYQIDKELGKGNGDKMMDRLCGVDFVSVNEFASHSTAPTSTRAMTVELHYEPYMAKADQTERNPVFAEVLQRTLSRETPLRAFNQSSGSYETIVQRKIVTTLPNVLSLSCACAGRKEEEGLFVWRGNGPDQDHWLPESIEVELTDNGGVIVRQLVHNLQSGTKEWKSHGDGESISESIQDMLTNVDRRSARKKRYELCGVVSLVRDDLDRNASEEMILMNEEKSSFGHHVLHAKIPHAHETRLLNLQVAEGSDFLSRDCTNPLTLINDDDKDSVEERINTVKGRLDELSDGADNFTEWVLMNGFKVSRASAEDARAFHVSFKEPCIVMYRCMDIIESSGQDEEAPCLVPPEVICTRSLTNNTRSEYASSQRIPVLPGKGDLIAFDAEFVSVQEDVTKLTEAGSKLTISETRHAVARISVITCASKSVLFDDFVLPQEKVVDYLTRFSGIVERDLNPKESPRHLISTRAAYLKLRCLIERGCVFVGHGLNRDFWTANLNVPPYQVIDTVEIYHKPAQRYVSLRFLTNFVLKRDMQQEVHDSLEDAMAAYELYLKAVELKKAGQFEKLLDDLYEHGQKVDWKLGMDEEEDLIG